LTARLALRPRLPARSRGTAAGVDNPDQSSGISTAASCFG
jgi:hypothetical protein